MTGLIAHEWIEKAGGAERVLDSFVDMYPEADVYCLWNVAPERYPKGKVAESPLARSPLRGRKALSLPLMPLVWRDLPEGEYDWMLVSSHLFAHHARTASVDADRTFVYAHTPARYLWAPELDERGRSPLVRSVAPVLRALDARRARRHSHLAANSAFVRDRIRATWRVDAEVIHPPVAVERLQNMADWTRALDDEERAVFDALPDEYILGASRFVGYKRLDVAIAAGAASGVPVVIAGSGPEEAQLRDVAQHSDVEVHFVLQPTDALMAALMQNALVYVFVPVEDFGIMPVEAMALGTPVIVNEIGGASESVVDGETGVALGSFDAASLRRAVAAAREMDPGAARARARRFDEARFQRDIRSWMAAA